jgi:hypothetical protein
MNIVKVMVVSQILAEAVEALGSIPSGHLYAHVMNHIDLETYNAAIKALTDDKKVQLAHHELTWIGGKK